ncbi:MAG: glucose 1-dehydrogenase [Acidobacteriota bacterium]
MSEQTSPDRFDLTGKVALVTGASKGIGAAMAHGFAAHGATVVVSSRKQEAVDAVAAEIRDAGGEAIAMACHVGRMDEVRGIVDKVVAACGGLDIVVNNAATNPVYGGAIEVDERAFDKIIEVNLKGPFELAKAAHPVMKARGGGAILNISSIGGISPEPNLGIYSVSKAALINLTKVLAAEWGGDGIRVNAIGPGLIKTKLSAALWTDDDERRKYEEHVPLGRIGYPEDIVGMALLLCSPAGAFCTGGMYMVDGGHTI